MFERTIVNPVTGERATFLETSRESAGARTVADLEVLPGGGVPVHQHAGNDERIEVLAGEIEVLIDGATRRARRGETVVIPRGAVHAWRNPSAQENLTFRGTMTPGHPGFETVLRVLFGLGRDGQLRKNGLPRRLVDMALLADWDPSLLAVGARRLLAPFMRWSARSKTARHRAQELLVRYGGDDSES